MIETLESLPSPEREHMLQWYAHITGNGFFKNLGKEDLLQAAFSEYVRYKYPKVLYHHSPNEGRRGKFAQWLLKLFTVRSMPDCMFYAPKFKENGIKHCGLCIELKIKPNKLSANQQTVLQELEQAGWYQAVCYDLSSAITILNNYMK